MSELDIAMAAHISDLAHRLTEDAPEVAVLPGVDAVRDGDIEIEDSDRPTELPTQETWAGGARF